MANSYPIELRERVVESYRDGEGTMKELAVRYKVGEATVERWVSRWKKTGSYAALPDSGGAVWRKLFEEHDAALIAWLDEEPDLTNSELAARLLDHFDIVLDPSQISRALGRLGYTRKKRPSATTAHKDRTSKGNDTPSP